MNENKKFYIVFNEESLNFKVCKIGKQFLTHSKDLILDTFGLSFETLKEAQIFFYGNFVFKVGSSSEYYFKIVWMTDKEHKDYIKYLKGGLK
jgi:hypothetical protein